MPDNGPKDDIAARLLEAAAYMQRFQEEHVVPLQTTFDKAYLDLVDRARQSGHDLDQSAQAAIQVMNRTLMPTRPLTPSTGLSGLLSVCAPGGIDDIAAELEFDHNRPIHAKKLASLLSGMRKAEHSFTQILEGQKATVGAMHAAVSHWILAIGEAVKYCRSLARMLRGDGEETRAQGGRRKRKLAWPPPGYIGVKAITTALKYRKNGKNPPRSTIQRWVAAEKPRSTKRDPETGECFYPESWVDRRWKRWMPQVRHGQ